MVETWTSFEFEQLQPFSAHDWARWLEDGLTIWYEQQDIMQAFAPVADRFSPSRRIEEQIIEMYDTLPDSIARRFLEALLILFLEETNKEEEAEYWEEAVEEIAGAIAYRLEHPHLSHSLPE